MAEGEPSYHEPFPAPRSLQNPDSNRPPPTHTHGLDWAGGRTCLTVRVPPVTCAIRSWTSAHLCPAGAAAKASTASRRASSSCSVHLVQVRVPPPPPPPPWPVGCCPDGERAPTVSRPLGERSSPWALRPRGERSWAASRRVGEWRSDPPRRASPAGPGPACARA